ncbi:uncharacterized protein LOC116128725 [Pistacia vera]|uniref:uncharacterized protein LOC116128725 n=1 Tax=Pistacia vera TaxID=55513 RepID=UPI00126322F9|nr:uncharacterized protein LOC116128725 [Pistacia vera]
MEMNANKASSNENTDIVILDGIVDYIFSKGRSPYDHELEDFINNRLEMDLPVSQYLEIIKRLKKTYREQVGKMGNDLALQDPHNVKLFDLADIVWSADDFCESEDEMEEESEDPKVEQELSFSGINGCDDLNGLLPIMFKSTVEEGPESLMRSLMLQSPVPTWDRQFDGLHNTVESIMREGPASILRSVMVEDAIPLAILPPLRPYKEDFNTALSSDKENIPRENL